MRSGIINRARGNAVFAAALVLLAVLVVWSPGGAEGQAKAQRPSFTVEPAGALVPGFRWNTSDYAVRCVQRPLSLRIEGAPGWKSKLGSKGLRGGSYTVTLPSAEGRRTAVTFDDGEKAKTFHLRCLPDDFPEYEFERTRRGGPEFTFVQIRPQYAVVFDRNGVPVYWYKAKGEPDNFLFLRDGTITYDPVDQIALQEGDYEIRTLRGRLLRTIDGTGGELADIHELQLLGNGNYLFGQQIVKSGVDASAYGKSQNSTIGGIELLEETPKGKVVYRWNSFNHIGIEETGRWWGLAPFLSFEPYDTVHWNSVQRVGNFFYFSARHLDAVYKINRKTKQIVWKLGGTTTPESLKVLGDPYGDYPLGGNHDIRFGPDNTVSVYDNRFMLEGLPRVVQYKINERKGTARLINTITDPEVTASFCCGSARLLPSGDWLVGWGGNSITGAYTEEGRRIWALRTPGSFSYRSNPVPPGNLAIEDLRDAMDDIAAR